MDLIGLQNLSESEWEKHPNACPVCGFRKGDHYQFGYCPTVDNRDPFYYPPTGGREPKNVRGRYGVPLTVKITTQASVSATGQAINDHVCPTCTNNRCSKSEKSCWKCGGKL